MILQVQFLPRSHDWNWSLQQRYERTTTREGFCHCCLRLDCPLVVLCVPLFWYLCLWFWSLLYTYVISGYISYNFVIGAYSYWGPKAGQEIYNMVNAVSLTHIRQCLSIYVHYNNAVFHNSSQLSTFFVHWVTFHVEFWTSGECRSYVWWNYYSVWNCWNTSRRFHPWQDWVYYS